MSVGRRGSPLADAVLTEDISTDEMAPGLTIMASNLEDWDGLITCVTSEARVTHGHFLHVKVTRQYWVVFAKPSASTRFRQGRGDPVLQWNTG